MDKIDTLIIGAGVVGLAIAARLSHSRSVIVIDKETHFGEHTSSRNSEVIHAGIYYPKDSLKQRLCINGKVLLYDRCQRLNIPCQQLGKFIVATNAEEAQQLARIKQAAHNNSVTDVDFASTHTINQHLSDLTVHSALFSPSTGILDSHQLMLSLVAEIEANGGIVATQTEFIQSQQTAVGFTVTMHCNNEHYTLSCEQLINCAGLTAPDVMAKITGSSKTQAKAYYCRGRYYRYQGKHPFAHLVYPIPNTHGLGIHATLDLAGQVKFGPDTEYVNNIDYRFDDAQKAQFVRAIKQYWPGLDPNRLTPDYTGIRPKLDRHQQSDFVIEFEATHGIANFVNLMGIESPGLTACLAIAEYVEQRL
ncbi:NAD(P)/FAD-dependent oxidoreductase [Pseudoalteromonas piscicida]|uniref:FAD-dependent oxidoreductase n=1 Tax=Pseudoalteromonas piscicida TaxID=43662 RepID=A0A2A5JNH3_PSEO7|nr:NAD(P)/FAD-dependent oxidoreductase [Pseudoalteromonas piscicida]PCK30811.1 FAD-dependent oxidoreductase [Pseudoalteromonas piscicida]